jgi:hypothetical protein
MPRCTRRVRGRTALGGRRSSSSPGTWFLNPATRQLAGKHNFDAVRVMHLEKRTGAGRYHYSVVRLDLSDAMRPCGRGQCGRLRDLDRPAGPGVARVPVYSSATPVIVRSMVDQAPASHFFIKLVFAAPASFLPSLPTALTSQHFFIELSLAAPASGLPSLPTALAAHAAPS